MRLIPVLALLLITSVLPIGCGNDLPESPLEKDNKTSTSLDEIFLCDDSNNILADNIVKPLDPSSSTYKHDYFRNLKPGVTMDDVVTAVGEPDAEINRKPIYRLSQGRIELILDGKAVVRCTHIKPAEGTAAECLYLSEEPHGPSEEESNQRERLLSKRCFMDIREWGKKYVWTSLYGGNVFLLKDGYIVIEPTSPLLGNMGAFAHTVSRATVYRGDKAKVVWRFFEHWDQVCPKGVTEKVLLTREATLKKYGASDTNSLLKVLGEPDGRMGSGTDYQQFYIHDGLITISGKNIRFEQPGMDKQISFQEWLTKSGANGK
jgi:hypothetical protein